MADPQLLQNDWSLGMKQDFSRDELPPGSCWNMVDYVPQDLGAPLRKRGGWTYSSPDLSTVKATASWVQWVQSIGFSGGTELLALDEDGELYEITDASNATDVGLVHASVQPVQSSFHRDLLIFPIAGVAPKKYDGSTIANLGGSPPLGLYTAVYKDRLLLGRVSGGNMLQRLYFSGAGNPESWDTTNSYIDTSDQITGLAVLQDAVLVFHSRSMERIRGNTPPPGSDMVREPLWGTGTASPGSICSYRDKVIWANAAGVYWTDGAAVEDLTSRGGIKRYYADLFPTTTTISAETFRNYLFITLTDGTTLIDTLVCRLTDFSWFRMANMPTKAYGKSQSASERELYFGLRNSPRVAKASSMFVPTASVKNDADGTAVTPSAETPFYLGHPGFKTWRNVYTGYDLRDAATDNPAITVSYITSPEATSYTNLSPTLTETTAYSRKRRPIRLASHGMAFKYTQANASSDTRLYSIEAEAQAREHGRV